MASPLAAAGAYANIAKLSADPSSAALAGIGGGPGQKRNQLLPPC